MSSNDLERLRADLTTVRNALGIDLVWSKSDVWFCAAISVAGGLYAVLSWPKSPIEVTSIWAAAPLLLVVALYLIYMAVKSRRLPPRDEPRRREYKSTLVALACTIPAVVAYSMWGRHVGMTTVQLSGSLLALMGVAFLVIGVAQPPIRYPRSYFIVGALPLIAFGMLLPLAPPSYGQSLIGLMGLVELGLAAFIVDRHIRRSCAESGNHVEH